jgi:hypothetical protein
MKHAVKLLIPALALAVLAPRSQAQTATTQRENVYVWPFAQKGKDKELAGHLTREFEQALTDDSEFDVLERGDLPRLWNHRQNEPVILDILDLPQEARKQLKAKQADMVVFGEVHDDQNSGEVIVTVVFQDFSGHQRLAKSEKFTRGKRYDPDSRRKAMQQLVQDLSNAARRQQRIPLPPARIPGPPLLGPGTGPGTSVQTHDFLFVLQGCHVVEARVSCRLQITSQGKERKLMLYTTRKDSARNTTTRSLIHGQANRQAVASQAMFADKKSYFGRVSAILPAGRPTDATVEFKGFPSQAGSIERLEIACKDLVREQDFTVEFRDITLGP